MAGRTGFLESEEAAVRKICVTFGCVYATVKPNCSIKYSDEVVIDFQEKDGCQVAAVATDQEQYVMPGAMTSDGFTPFENASSMYQEALEQTITSRQRPSGRPGGQVIFNFSSKG